MNKDINTATFNYFEFYLKKFLNYLEKEKRYSYWTIKIYTEDLGYFVKWCMERTYSSIGDITRDVIEKYQLYLLEYRKKNGDSLCVETKRGRLYKIKHFFKWLSQRNYILYNPASEVQLPREGRRLPRHVLTVSEVHKILNLPDISHVLGLRDRAILETLYSTGIRIMQALYF